MYVLIGWIALEIAFGNSSQQADKSGAMRTLSSTPVGAAGLWLLVVGFFGMALWRLCEAIYGAPGPGGRKATTRLGALGRVVIYGVTGFGVLKYALGAGGPQSTDKQSEDLTAALLRHQGGQALIVIIGLALIAGGLVLAYQYWKKQFLKNMRFDGARAGTRRIVEWLGRVGGVARSVVFVTAGVFLIIAALRSQPQEAKGIDSSLRALAATPAGPWVLALTAAGLIMFGAFSCCEARWRRV
jgi:putative copper export protein